MAKRPQKNMPKIGFDEHGEYVFYTDDQREIDLAMHWRYDEDGPEDCLRFFWPHIFEEDQEKIALGIMTVEESRREHERIIWSGQRKDYIRFISDPAIPWEWAMGYRGFAKSTILRGECARVLILHLTPFLAWTSNELPSAIFSTETIRTLCNAPMVKLWFGDMRPESVDGMKADWGEKAWQLCDPITGIAFAAVAPVSEGQVINGKNVVVGYTTTRPTYIVSDDGEDRRFIDNSDLRRAHRDWWFGVVEPCVPNVRPNSETNRWSIQRGYPAPFLFRVPDTPKHIDCLILRLVKMTGQYVGKKYPIAVQREDGTFQSLCPEERSDEQVMQLFKKAQASMNEGYFWTEYMLDATHRSEECFPDEFWHYRESELRLGSNDDVFRFITSDPSETAGGCKYAAHAYAIDAFKSVVYLRKRFAKRMQWDEYIRELVSLAKSTNTRIVYVEGLNGKPMLRALLESESKKRGAHLEFRNLKTTTKQYAGNNDFGDRKDAAKCRRGANVSRMFLPFLPTHPNGHVCFEESIRDSELEGLLHSFPNCEEWDDPDCLGHVPAVMAEEHIEFHRQFDTDAERVAYEEEENAYDPQFACAGVSDDW